MGASALVVMLAMSLATTSHARELETPHGESRDRVQPLVGVIVATLGVVGFGTAVVLGRDRAKQDGATAHCSVDVCTSTAMLLVEDARAQSDTAFRLMGVSAFALVSGVVLYLTSGTATRSHSEIALAAGGITFKTSF